MSNTVKTVLKTLGVLIGFALALTLMLVLWLTVTEYKPEAVEPLEIAENSSKALSTDEVLSILTFNTGYAGLGEEEDFFMDGGKGVRPEDKKTVLKNLNGISNTVLSINPDILLLQEVDEQSKRSFFVNQCEKYRDLFKGDSAFAYNYACDYVPYPLPTIGTVHSGIMTFSKYEMTSAERIALPCPFEWPVSAANLKRCLLISRHSIEGSDKELVVVNLHLEAYDDGEGKIAQTKQLWGILEEEYKKGNYVIAGGDFNQSFPGGTDSFPIRNPELWTPGLLDEPTEGFEYAYEAGNPTCRLLNKPYAKYSEGTQYYLIDGFIVSENIEVVKVETISGDFKFSDHNPVLLEVKLK